MVAVSSAWKNFTSDFCLSLHNLAPVIIIIIIFFNHSFTYSPFRHSNPFALEC